MEVLSLFADIMSQIYSEFLWLRFYTYFLIGWTKSEPDKNYSIKAYIFVFMFNIITGQIVSICFVKETGWEKFKLLKNQRFSGLIRIQTLIKNFYWKGIYFQV